MSTLLLQNTGSGGCRVVVDSLCFLGDALNLHHLCLLFSLCQGMRIGSTLLLINCREKPAPWGRGLPVCSLLDAQG